MMEKKDRSKLVAPCGLDCGVCELNMCKDNITLLNQLIKIGIPKENLPCQGCRAIQGNCPVLEEKCDTYKCISEKKIDFCYECNEFPCVSIQPAADRADTLPHNMKIYNLCIIKNLGLDSFINNSPEIKKRYFAGKMIIGKGPQI